MYSRDSLGVAVNRLDVLVVDEEAEGNLDVALETGVVEGVLEDGSGHCWCFLERVCGNWRGKKSRGQLLYISTREAADSDQLWFVWSQEAGAHRHRQACGQEHGGSGARARGVADPGGAFDTEAEGRPGHAQCQCQCRLVMVMVRGKDWSSP